MHAVHSVQHLEIFNGKRGLHIFWSFKMSGGLGAETPALDDLGDFVTKQYILKTYFS